MDYTFNMDFYNLKSKDKTFAARKHNQIIHFSSGRKATITNIIKVWEDSLIHLVREDGVEYIVNKNNVDYSEILWIE